MMRNERIRSILDSIPYVVATVTAFLFFIYLEDKLDYMAIVSLGCLVERRMVSTILYFENVGANLIFYTLLGGHVFSKERDVIKYRFAIIKNKILFIESNKLLSNLNEGFIKPAPIWVKEKTPSILVKFILSMIFIIIIKPHDLERPMRAVFMVVVVVVTYLSDKFIDFIFIKRYKKAT